MTEDVQLDFDFVAAMIISLNNAYETYCSTVCTINMNASIAKERTVVEQETLRYEDFSIGFLRTKKEYFKELNRNLQVKYKDLYEKDFEVF